MISRRRFIISSGALSFAPLIPNVVFGGKLSEYPYAYIHNHVCGGIAFRLNHMPSANDRLSSHGVIKPNGESIYECSEIMCYHCNEPFISRPRRSDIVYWRLSP